MIEEEASNPQRMLRDIPWPLGLAVRMIAASGISQGRHEPEEAIAVSPRPGQSERGHPLPPPQELVGVERTLADVVTARRSGGITSGRLSATSFSTLLGVTAEALPHALLPHPLLGPAVFPLIFDVEGIPPGAYRYEPGQRAVAPVQTVRREAVREDLLLQREHGDGSAIIFIAVPMARWLHHFGDRGYRGATLQVGYLTDRLYLAAETLGLTYTASGGFAPARADLLLGLDGYHHTTMFSFVVGARRAPQQEGSHER